jgi:hypothetical protein
MTTHYINFDNNQKKLIRNFLNYPIKKSDIKDNEGRVIGAEYGDWPTSKLLTVDLIIHHCEKQRVFITSNEVIKLLEKYCVEKKGVDLFIKTLDDLFTKEMTVIIPNNILFLDKDVIYFNFGDAITCIRSSKIKEHIEQIYANKSWLNVALEGLPSTESSFIVKIKRCTTDSAHIMAKKTLNIALSLLKIFSRYKQLHFVYQDRDLEHNAFLPKFNQNPGIICFRNGGVSIINNDLSSSYKILPNTAAELQQDDFNRICNNIFFGDKPIFQEIKRALDFMTRARIESEDNMKMVFLIFALESFVPKKQKNTGVLQKLQQLVSAIIEFEDQHTKKVIERFYSLRSNIIHSNKNYVSTTDYNLLKRITEDICFFYIQDSCAYSTIDEVFNSIVPVELDKIP